MSGLHGIPVVYWVTAEHREEAASIAKMCADRSLQGSTFNDFALDVAFSMPNDTGDEDWHLEWKRGPAAQPLDEEWEFDPINQEIRRIDHG